MSDWIEWNGGDCPVPAGYKGRVETRYVGDGKIAAEVMTADQARELRWENTGGLGDITDYRLVGESADSKPEMLLKPSQRPMILPADPAERKGIPITTGVIDYFPRALAEVARVSKAGNDQHNPGQPLHWSKDKSTDHADCIPRHLIDRFTRDADGQRHAAKMAWRSLAFLETLLEDEETGGQRPGGPTSTGRLRIHDKGLTMPSEPQTSLRLYVSGPMSGLPEFNFPAFHATAAALRAKGYDVVNPAEVNVDTTMTWEQCLREDIKHLCDCDALALLPGWENSKGAHLEVHIAHRLGLRVEHVETLL